MQSRRFKPVESGQAASAPQHRGETPKKEERGQAGIPATLEGNIDNAIDKKHDPVKRAASTRPCHTVAGLAAPGICRCRSDHRYRAWNGGRQMNALTDIKLEDKRIATPQEQTTPIIKAECYGSTAYLPILAGKPIQEAATEQPHAQWLAVVHDVVGLGPAGFHQQTLQRFCVSRITPRACVCCAGPVNLPGVRGRRCRPRPCVDGRDQVAPLRGMAAVSHGAFDTCASRAVPPGRTLAMTENVSQDGAARIVPNWIRAHVELVHRLAQPLAGRGKVIVAGFGEDPDQINPNTSKPARRLRPKVMHAAVGDVRDTLVRVAEIVQLRHYNLYMPLAVFRPNLIPGAKGIESDIVSCLGLVADFDDPEAARWAERLPLPPNYVLEPSAGRFQACYLFDKPEALEAVKSVAEHLKTFAHCDDGTCDIAHDWRVPGALNWPNAKEVAEGRPREPQLVRVAKAWDGGTTELQVLSNLLPGRDTKADRDEAPASRQTMEGESGHSRCLDAALEYATQGFSVILLHGINDEGYCTCGKPGCHSAGKHPIGKSWKQFQTKPQTPEELIDAFNKHPHANVGIITGEISGVLVVDSDGPEGFDSFCKVIGNEPPELPIVKTGKGYHFYGRHPGGKLKNFVKIHPGLDGRGDGGYVVAPPSRHADGHEYKWTNGLTSPLPDLPPGLLNLFTSSDDQSGGAVNTVTRSDKRKEAAESLMIPFNGRAPTRLKQCAVEELGKQCKYVTQASIGQQEATLSAIGLKIGNYVGAGLLGFGQARDALVEAALQMQNAPGRPRWTRAEIVKKVDDKLRVGMQSPKWGRDPRGEDEDRSPPLDIFGDTGLLAPPEFPVDALPSVLKAFVVDRAERLGVKPELIAMPALAVCAAAIDDRVVVQVRRYDQQWLESPRIWVAIIEEPGGKKTPAINGAVSALRDIEVVWRSEDAPALQKYEIDLERYKAQLKKHCSDTDADDASSGFLQPAKPPMRRLVVTDATTEALAKILAENPLHPLNCSRPLRHPLRAPRGLDTKRRSI
jgi:hypothetical protein